MSRPCETSTCWNQSASREIELEPVAGGEPCVAFTYFKSRILAKLTHSDYLSTYEDRRFIAPEDRVALLEPALHS
jgi:hypothetical protein